MGQRVIACAAADTPPWTLVAAIERAGHPRAGADAGTLAGLGPAGVAVADGWTVPADVVIDFSLPEAVSGIVAACVARNLPLVVATTGLEDRERRAIAEAARSIPILQSPSMSLAVNIAMDLVGRAGGLLARVGGRTDVEIIECHHRHKEDSPSGTALKFGAIVREQMRQTSEVHGRAGRPGAAARAQGAALRIYFSQRRRRTTDAFARERIIRDELAVSHPCRPRRSRRQAGCEGHEVGR